MRKLILICLVLLCGNFVSAQQKEPIPSGIVTFSNGKMTGFTNLRFIDGKVLFYNVATRTNDLHTLDDIASIADDSQKVIYKGVLKKQEPQQITEQKPLIDNDTLYKPGYPEGIYRTKEEFLAKTPGYTEHLLPRSIEGTDYYLNNIVDQCYFIKDDDRKLKKVFAVCYKGYLYFRVGAIEKSLNSKDRAQDSDFPHSFARVIIGGNNFLYMEADFADIWGQGATVVAFGAIAGTIISNSMYLKKGIVWDIKNSEFNIFRSCSDYKKFISPLLTGASQKCKEKFPDLITVRRDIEKIK